MIGARMYSADGRWIHRVSLSSIHQWPLDATLSSDRYFTRYAHPTHLTVYSLPAARYDAPTHTDLYATPWEEPPPMSSPNKLSTMMKHRRTTRNITDHPHRTRLAGTGVLRKWCRCVRRRLRLCHSLYWIWYV